MFFLKVNTYVILTSSYSKKRRDSFKKRKEDGCKIFYFDKL
jgi:hypothetical protein